jgi:predicted ATPase
LIGRDTDLARIDSLFASGRRAVTILGPGGAGKTRLALEYARGRDRDLEAGAHVCDLSDTRDASGFWELVSRALGLAANNEAPAQVIARALDGGRSVLLPWFSFFLIRARLVEPTLELDADKAADIARIVRDLDGIPLAIELAAARVGLLGVVALKDLLVRRLDLLADRTKGRHPRHATIRATGDAKPWAKLDWLLSTRDCTDWYGMLTSCPDPASSTKTKPSTEP